MIYYGLLTASAMMFGVQFLMNQLYQRRRGSSFKGTLRFVCGSNIVGSIILFCINGFKFEFSPFAFIMAMLTAVNILSFNAVSLKAFGKTNLSLYSIISMLGGMALPFIGGILFFDEAFTVAKLICFITITIALFVTFQRGEKSKLKIYYAAIFIMNGLAGIIAKFYWVADFPKIDSEGYSLLISLSSVLLSGILMIFVKGEEMKFDRKCALYIGTYGVLSNLGNLFLVISLNHLPASAQYPFITGGVMIFSTLIAFITKQHPSRRELISVVISFVGILALILIPI